MAVQCGKSVLATAGLVISAPQTIFRLGRCMQTNGSLSYASCLIPSRRRCILAAMSGTNSVQWNRIKSHWNNKYLSTVGTSWLHLLEPVNLSHLSVIRTMAGHSKWQNIRHTKAAKDALRSRVANKITQRIRIAVKLGGGIDPKLNSQLARVLEEGQRNDVPNATMEQVLKRMGKEKETGSVVVVEARGPGNCFLMIETFTDKPNRTRQMVQHILKKYGGKIGNSGVASHAFELKGVVHVPSESALTDLEKATEIAIEAGAEEVDLSKDSQGDSVYRFMCDAKDVHAVKQHLEEQGLPVTHANQDYVAQVFSTLNTDQLELTAGLLDALEDMEDVNRVFDNVDPQCDMSASSETSSN